jgi:hypothetical protein
LARQASPSARDLKVVDQREALLVLRLHALGEQGDPGRGCDRQQHLQSVEQAVDDGDVLGIGHDLHGQQQDEAAAPEPAQEPPDLPFPKPPHLIASAASRPTAASRTIPARPASGSDFRRLDGSRRMSCARRRPPQSQRVWRHRGFYPETNSRKRRLQASRHRGKGEAG